MTFILRALAATALILAPGICAAADTDVRDGATKDTINLARPHHHKADADAKTDAAPNTRTHADTTTGQSRTRGPGMGDKADMHPSDPHKTAHMPGTKSATSTPDADIVVAPVPFHPNSHGPASVIDKKTATAIGLVRPHHDRAGATTAQGRTIVTPANNGSRGVRTVPVQGSVKTAIAAKGNTPTPTPDLRASTVTRGDNVAKVAPLTVQPRNLAAIHDAVLTGTSVRRPATMIANIGGAAIRKSTAIINGTDFRRRPH